jgi:hypothetical protein
MTTYTCPKGHPSTDADFCSNCGTRIGPPESLLSAAPGEGPIKCPDCGTLHTTASVRFCEVCGYNFETGGHGEVPAPPPPAVAPPLLPPLLPPLPPPAPLVWDLLVIVDPSLRTAESPEAPANQAPQQIRLSKESSLIGRRSMARAIEPDIALDPDAAVSHRHALLLLQPDQTLLLRDIGSSNGTAVNGSEIPPMTDTPLKDGDQITLGHWTRIVVHTGARAI